MEKMDLPGDAQEPGETTPTLEPRVLHVLVVYWTWQKTEEEAVLTPTILNLEQCTRIEFSPNSAKSVRLSDMEKGQYRIEMDKIIQMEVEVRWWNVTPAKPLVKP